MLNEQLRAHYVSATPETAPGLFRDGQRIPYEEFEATIAPYLAADPQRQQEQANVLQQLAASGQNPQPAQSADPITMQPAAAPADPGAYYPPAPEVPPPPPQAPQEPTNVMQTLAPPPPVASPPPQAPQMTAEPPKRRRSLLDTVGRLADVIAKVGGAEALYQPTLDAREDRALGLEDRLRKVDLDKLALETGRGEFGDAQALRIGQAARGVKAIMAANPSASPAQIWPLIAEKMGVPADQIQVIGAQLGQNPELLDGLISGTTDPKLQQSKFGGSVVYAKGPNGEIAAFQPGLGDDGARSILPEGYEAIDPLKFVDLGGSQAGVGTRSGRVSRILPKTEVPGKAADRASRERIAASGNVSRERVAAMKGDKAGPDPAMVEAAQGNLDELRTIFNDLNKMGAMVSPSRSTGANVAARARSSLVGQTLEGAVGTEAQTKRDRVASIRPQLMQALAKATGMTGRQLDSNADVKLFMQTVTDPTRSYEANIKAIEGLERFLKANTKKPTAAPKQAPAGSGGWSVIGVD